MKDSTGRPNQLTAADKENADLAYRCVSRFLIRSWFRLWSCCHDSKTVQKSRTLNRVCVVNFSHQVFLVLRECVMFSHFRRLCTRRGPCVQERFTFCVLGVGHRGCFGPGSSRLDLSCNSVDLMLAGACFVLLTLYCGLPCSGIDVQMCCDLIRRLEVE